MAEEILTLYVPCIMLFNTVYLKPTSEHWVVYTKITH
jgi:hypothetical protein